MSTFRRERAERRLIRAERALAISKGLFAVYMVAATIILMAQLYSVQQSQFEQLEQARQALEKSLSDNEAQHRRTQDYIKCIANALLIPTALRTSELFDQCGIDATTEAGSTVAPGATPAVLPSTSSSPTTPKPPQTTSEPPDPNDDRSQGGAIRTLIDLVTGLIPSI